jgi:CDP-2,3-bis-(O-geranylgeranyl)-sn-glycerol synthase
VAIAQTLWFKSSASRRFAAPLDFGKRFRGKRLLGDHKTFRGFVVFVPMASAMFLLLSQAIRVTDPALAQGLWAVSPGAYALLGFVAGMGFMLGELPNSFLKRQFGIRPGESPPTRLGRILQRVMDRLDSIVGMLIAISLTVHTPWPVWLYLCLLGPGVHEFFSFLLSRLGVKGVPA